MSTSVCVQRERKKENLLKFYFFVLDQCTAEFLMSLTKGIVVTSLSTLPKNFHFIDTFTSAVILFCVVFFNDFLITGFMFVRFC